MISLNLKQPEHRSNPLENPGVSLAGGVDYLLSISNGGTTASGENITEQSAMQITTFWACVSAIARAVSSLPAYLYERTDSGHERAVNNPIYSLLTVAPNEEMSPISFFEAVTASIAASGNGFAEIQRNGAGQPVALWPRISQCVKPTRLANGDLAYEVRIPNTNPYVIKAANMIHVPALALDGIMGLNPVAQNRQALGLAAAEQKSAARLFGNGIMSQGGLSLPAGMTAPQKELFKDSLEKNHTGENQHRPIVFPFDVKWVQMTINPADAQFLESRKYSAEQICSMMGVPPHKVGILTRSTNNNIEHQAIEWLTDTIRPLLVRWEQELTRKLLPAVGCKANKFFIRFDVNELLRGDSVAQSAKYASGRQWGYETINSILIAEGKNPIGPEGDVYMVPLNMINAKQLLPGADPSPLLAQDPADQPDSDLPDESSRTLIKRMSTAYSRLFRDAIGRVTSREKRDSEVIRRVFDPVLTTIADEAIRQAKATLRVAVDYKPDVTGILRDVYRSIEKRAAAWTLESVDTNTEIELTKAVKAILIGTFNDAASSLIVGVA
jgi:HK97 family phage portal protein